MLLSILLTLFFLLLIYLLWMPVVLCVNTVTHQYYIEFKGFAKASIESHKEEVLKIKLKLFIFNFYFYPLRKNRKANKKNKPEKPKNKKPKSRISLQTALRVLNSFKVKRFFLNIDTGDCIYNANLYPLFALLNYRVGGFNINFDNKNQMVIYLKNRPLYIIKSIINI